MINSELTQKEIELVNDIVIKNNDILLEATPEQVFEFITRLIERILVDRLMEDITYTHGDDIGESQEFNWTKC